MPWSTRSDTTSSLPCSARAWSGDTRGVTPGIALRSRDTGEVTATGHGIGMRVVAVPDGLVSHSTQVQEDTDQASSRYRTLHAWKGVSERERK
eukprot:2079344-Rhodomonas_salina.1